MTNYERAILFLAGLTIFLEELVEPPAYIWAWVLEFPVNLFFVVYCLVKTGKYLYLWGKDARRQSPG
jgi:hypothetical protein